MPMQELTTAGTGTNLATYVLTEKIVQFRVHRGLAFTEVSFQLRLQSDRRAAHITPSFFICAIRTAARSLVALPMSATSWVRVVPDQITFSLRVSHKVDSMVNIL